MSELEDFGIDLDTLRVMLDEWRGGAKKSELERRYLNRPESHGKLFTTLVRRHLGIETERRSTQSARIAQLESEVVRLRALLDAHGIDATPPPADELRTVCGGGQCERRIIRPAGIRPPGRADRRNVPCRRWFAVARRR